MFNIAPGGRLPVPAAKTAGRRRAAGIYGAIITAAILDTAGGRLPTDALIVAVVATLAVYWLAEQYAELLGEEVEGGVVPTWAHIREGLAATSPMVSASFLPWSSCSWSTHGPPGDRPSCTDGNFWSPRRLPRAWAWPWSRSKTWFSSTCTNRCPVSV